jgi:hypothetical protein
MEELEMLIWLGSCAINKKKGTEVAVPYISILEEPLSPRRSCGDKACLGSGAWHIFIMLFIRFLGRLMHGFIEGI